MTDTTVPNTVPNLLETGLQFIEEIQTDPMMKAQFELEDNMKAEGVKRYERNRAAVERDGLEGDLVPQQDLIRENILRVADGITAYLEADKERLANQTGRGRRQPKVSTLWLSKLSMELYDFTIKGGHRATQFRKDAALFTAAADLGRIHLVK